MNYKNCDTWDVPNPAAHKASKPLVFIVIIAAALVLAIGTFVIGQQSGYHKGYEYGHNVGYNDGYKEGYTRGDERGYSAGYSAGYTEGKQVNAPKEHVTVTYNGTGKK